MSYRVVYTDEVMCDVARRIDQLREYHVSENTIASWFSDLFDTINDLYEMPRLYSIDELESNRSGFIIRKWGSATTSYAIASTKRTALSM